VSKFLPCTCLVVIGVILPHFLSGCNGPSSSTSSIHSESAWSKHSLDAGPDIRVRLIRKAYFSRAVIEWREGAMILTDGQGQIIPYPPDVRKIYFRMRGDCVAVAFQRHSAAFKRAKAYRMVWLRTVDNQVQIFGVHIPERRFLREYEARVFNVSVKYGRLAIINTLPMELYLARVIPEEMDPEHFTLEALKAQAVVARTWALKNIKRHARFGYDFCDGPHCQVYKGRKQVSSRAEQAVKMTLGEVLMYKDRLAEAFYHSTCGGNTVFVNEVWAGRRIPYLRRVEDHWKAGNRPYCAQSPYARWRVYTSIRRVERALQRQKWLGKKEHLENIQVDFVNCSGRVKRIRVTTDKREFLLKANEFRNVLNHEYGRRKLLSNFFSIETQGNQFRIQGYGLGHGVGMCQWGARGMAQHGFSYREILSHYFQGTRLGKNYGEQEVLPLSDVTTQNSQAGVK